MIPPNARRVKRTRDLRRRARFAPPDHAPAGYVRFAGTRGYLVWSGVALELEPPMRVRWNHRIYVMVMGSWIFVPMVVRDISSGMAP